MKRTHLVIVLLLGFFVLGFSGENAVGGDKPYVNAIKKVDKNYEKRMVQGLMAMRGSYPHVNKAYAERLVKEAIEVTSMKGNQLMKPHDLLGMALNETDLRGWLITGTYSKPDCGITQNHTPLFAKSLKARRALCVRLTKSTKLSFIYAMKEMNMNRSKYCLRIYRKPVKRKTETLKSFGKRIYKWRNNQFRCAYNLYLQGPNYLRGPCTKRIRKKGRTPQEYWKRVARCRFNNNYWLRSMCFAKGVEIGKKPKYSCRRAGSMWWIRWVYGL